MLCMTKVANDSPLQWTVYQMCRLYECTPSELFAQDAEIVRQHYAIHRTLNQAANG